MGRFNKDKIQALPCGMPKGAFQSFFAVSRFSVCLCRLSTLPALCEGEGKDLPVTIQCGLIFTGMSGILP